MTTLLKTKTYTENGLKICSDCKIPQSKENYYISSHTWDGVKNICKTCDCKRSRLRDKDKERIRRHIKYLKYKDRELKTVAEYKVKRSQTDSGFKMLRSLRDRHSKAVKAAGVNKTFRTTDLLGCTAEELKQHFEKQFTNDMNWSNHGTVWQIDHIYPLALVNWDNPFEISKICHYTNLQPLTIQENLSKGNRLKSHIKNIAL